ncbi:hypothetical protein [Mesorhizobium delmotii]|uniref:hypothetical protein n=1 Tax=Mesorhizobium delmotii TaxID=1631247 RepID=UPI0010577F3E|nr:hypothetical protein [Mesorhizobium delmotii]
MALKAKLEKCDETKRPARAGSLQAWCEQYVAWIAEVDVEEAAFWQNQFTNTKVARYWRAWSAEQEKALGPKITANGSRLDA